MLRDVRAIFTTWPFVVSVLALLVNDAWLKPTFPGFVSGKLSDFAGIAVVALLLLAALPARYHLVFGGIVAGFTWWKSPLSQFAIDAINAHLSFPIGRTVDYSDLVALLVIPICAIVTSSPAAFAIPGKALRRIVLVPVVALTVLGLTATSVIPTRHDYQIRRSDRGAELNHEAVADAVAQVAAQHGLKCEDCADRVNSGRYRGNGIYLSYAFIGNNAVLFEVQAYPDGMFLGISGAQKADRLRMDLKSRLASLFKDLEYVEQLSPTAGRTP